MKHEEILKEIEKQLMNNRTRRAYSYNSLERDNLRENNNLLGKIKTILKSADNDYERGCEDAWELARKIVDFVSCGGYSDQELDDIFGAGMGYREILRKYSYKEALAKVEAYEQEKKEEAEKPVVGDVVECAYKYDASRRFKGIVRDIDDSHIYIITKEHTHVTVLLKSEFDIKKTGKHIDIQGMLDEIE